MLLRQLFQKYRYQRLDVPQLDVEIAKKQKEIEAVPVAIDDVYESAAIFDGLGKTAGGFEEDSRMMLDIFWSRREKLQADLALLKEIRSKKLQSHAT